MERSKWTKPVNVVVVRGGRYAGLAGRIGVEACDCAGRSAELRQHDRQPTVDMIAAATGVDGVTVDLYVGLVSGIEDISARAGPICRTAGGKIGRHAPRLGRRSRLGGRPEKSPIYRA